MPFVAATAALAFGFQAAKVSELIAGQARETYQQILTNHDADVGRAYAKFTDMAKERVILSDSASWASGRALAEDKLVMAPPLKKLLNLWNSEKRHHSSVVYIMYTPAGQGKTTAARALLKTFYPLGTADLRGIMVSGNAMDGNYYDKFATLLDVGNVQGWVLALLLALDPGEDKAPSILIFDGFNSAGGDGEINIQFIKYLYDAISEMEANIFVVVCSSNKDLATKLCGVNGGMRVRPLPDCFSGETTKPEWSDSQWSIDQLKDLAKKMQPGKFEDDKKLDFIELGMTPLTVKLTIKAILRAPCPQPTSPSRKSKAGGN